jgi:hypothetical protein
MKFKLATIVAVVLAIGLSYTTGQLQAQLPVPPSSQFDLTGFLQEATLGGPGTGSGVGAHQGGSLKVNGHTVIVPSELVVILPANALTWQELFAQAPAPYTGVATGMAIADVPTPLTTYEVHVVGNRVGDTYIAGLVDIAQQGLNSGQGFINNIDYTLGEMRVGGVIGDATTGTRVRLNDPTGRYGRAMSPDPRFTVDADNPTITAGTGFPMCFPRFQPVAGGADDALCPQANRAGQGSSIQMRNPVTEPGLFPNALVQVPFEVGDYVTYAGTLVSDTAATPTAGPWPGTANTYVSAHTIEANLAVFTWPGTDPAYVRTDVTLIGTGGLTVIGAGEAAIRTRFEGMTTDPSRNVHLYGIDLDPLSGASTDRDWGTIGVDPGPPNGAVKGRWRFRPPCTAAVATDKACTPPPGGVFIPPTREMRAVIEGQQGQVPGLATAKTAANGIFYGQYHAPILEYIFPENIPGTPIVENNFNTIDFLAKGGYTSAGGTLVGQLNPWPSNVVPTPACTPAAASAGGPYTVASGSSVTLGGSGTGTGALTFAWVADRGTFSNAAIAAPIFTAPAVAVQTIANLSLTVTNSCGSATSPTSVTINAPASPTVNQVPPLSVSSGAQAQSFAISGSDPNVPALVPLAFTVTQAGPVVLGNLAVTSTGPNTATVSFNAPLLPVGQVTSSVVTLTIIARNSGGVSSAPSTTTVTVNPLTDAVVVTSAVYRTSKQRLVITATSSVISPSVVLTLQPYLTVGGTTFNPTNLGAVFTNNGSGLYTLTLVGAPQPAPPPATPLIIKSNLGGSSPPSALTQIRQ